MKTIISYVSGNAGDFIVNCCNQNWLEPTVQGSVIASATVKHLEIKLGSSDLMDYVNNLPYNYVGSHCIDTWLQMPVNVVWLVVPEQSSFEIWVARDAVLRSHSQLLGRHGRLYDTVCELVLSKQRAKAAKLYIDWLAEYNWTLMQMRLVQPTNKVDITNLLKPNGIASVFDQMPNMMTNFEQCCRYHELWLQRQSFYSDQRWVMDCVGAKLEKFVLHS